MVGPMHHSWAAFKEPELWRQGHGGPPGRECRVECTQPPGLEKLQICRAAEADLKPTGTTCYKKRYFYHSGSAKPKRRRDVTLILTGFLEK